MLGSGKEKNFMKDSWTIGLNDSVEWTEGQLTGRRVGLRSGIMPSESGDRRAARGERESR